KIGEDYKYFRGKFIPEFNTSNESIESILVTISDLSKGKINDIEVINAIYHDSLTGLINRNYFLKKLSDYITISQKETLGLGLIFFDVDNFHQINDTLGHSTGDELLKLISEKVPTILSENQLLCRYGGDEFSMIIIGRQENFKTYIASIAIDLMNLFDEPIEIDKNEITVSLSIGISIYPEDGKESLHLLKNAEKATYHIRQKEENSFTFFDQEMGQELIRKNKIIKELRRALDEDEFHLVYQPKIDLKSKTVHGVEALLRWKGNELISPSVFIPIAEESGMIIQIGEWVLSNAIKEISKLYQKGLKFNLAVNLSPKQFSIPRISNLILDMLSMHSFPAEMFEVEITEGTAMKNINQSSEILYDLDNKRINISIDDFGTGYSSLAYLKRFPINYLKIDRTFIKDLPDDKNSLSIVEAIILMAHNLDLKIIAEGVETKAQLQFLESKDCDFIQGYYYSPGLRVTELEEFLLNFQERFP
ncbi:MAG: bifunctional diguanylate cyclase/phosphodiesterase, partial [Leptospiraceae bacterium]|nr:bifunctional diguanylate cyclase/phosphodiesterase [Leptospiraceae bacterium]